ncbi:uncharacterized protein BO88DRAFT_402789 [Aspergillus vadensis CBS 113365]|uniref:Uncharacterized protein n=1 Tax=Aspergillus vadensis (strain CBS 113365 / IMI 142717 / IBT 24658) TaxID=1448311 RepID=A0A319BE28_ASPVC|nr:hypothetical protein BO88DRAFT_402789 [Aspergillus vadensis CBS 113365]PYH71436.1 hypothetical protein BO88DRAFT_402789 [Aspergillus vadensis CBS 113365]
MNKLVIVTGCDVSIISSTSTVQVNSAVGYVNGFLFVFVVSPFVLISVWILQSALSDQHTLFLFPHSLDEIPLRD